MRGVGRGERGNKGDREMGGERQRERERGESVRGVGKVPSRFKRFFIFFICAGVSHVGGCERKA